MAEDFKALLTKDGFKAKLQQLWNGDVPLKETFWLYYFAVMVILMVLGDITGIIGFIFGLASLVWAGFMVKPIIAAADKYEGDKNIALLAKVVAILIGLGVLGSLLGGGRYYY